MAVPAHPWQVPDVESLFFSGPLSVLSCVPMNLPLPALAALLGLSLVACKPSSQPSPDSGSAKGKPSVFAANYPMAFFVQQLAGTEVELLDPIPADEDPAFWQPDDKALSAIQAADLILLNGASYSKWAEKVSLPQAKVVDSSAAFAKAFIQIPEVASHSHGPGGDHSHSGTAFTTWMDLSQAAQQAQACAEGLKRLLPQGQHEAMDQRLKTLAGELLKLDTRLKACGQRLKNQPLVASHPVYDYFARAYQLNLKALLWEPEQTLDEKALGDLKALLQKHPAKWMIWEGEPSDANIAALKAKGLQSLVISPCANRPEQGNFLSVMQRNIEALEKAFP